MKTRLILSLFFILSIFIYAQNVGDTAPDFSLTDPNGVSYTLSQYQGQVVLLFVLGSSCPSCIAEGPNVQSLFEDFSDQGLVVLGLDVWDGSVTNVNNFITMAGVQFPVLLMASSLQNVYKTTYDRLIIIDQNGKIAYKGSRLVALDLKDARDVLTNLMQSSSIEFEAYPEMFDLFQNFPNPFNPSTDITYYLPDVHKVRLEVFDLLGNSIAVLVNEVQNAGDHQVHFESKDHSGGVYFYRLTAGGETLTRKMILAK